MIYIASDHGGFKLKKYLTRYLKNQLKLKYQDLGPTEYDEQDDYPDYAAPLAKKVAEDQNNRGILICGSGNGVCITANKIRSIRAALGYNIEAASLARQHNNANVLCLPGRVLTEEHGAEVMKTFLQTNFEAGRHQRRVEKISKLEKNN